MSYDDLNRERYRRDERRVLTPASDLSATPAMLVQVYQQTTLPTATGVFFACHPATAFGAESEGGSGTITVDTSQTVFVLVVGPKAPAAGDNLVARFIGNRWVAARMGAATGNLTIAVTGCAVANVGAAVTVNDSTGATMLASGATDGSGHYVPSYTFVSGTTYQIVVSQSGYATSTTSYTFPGGTPTNTVALAAASILHITFPDGSTAQFRGTGFTTPTFPTSFYWGGTIPSCLTTSGNVNVSPVWSCGSLAFTFGTRSCLSNGGAEYLNGGSASTAHAGFVSRSNGALLETFTIGSAGWPTTHPLFTGTCLITA